jgi:glycine betaine/proline transport system ATP-binding protein
VPAGVRTSTGTLSCGWQMNGSPILECRQLWKVYGPNAAEALKMTSGLGAAEAAAELRHQNYVGGVCDVTLSVGLGETFVIMGLSGSGKSTVIRCLSRLLEPTAGEIRIEGQDLLSLTEAQLIELRRHKMGMVFQHFGLLPHMTVLDNVAYPLRVQGIPRQDRERRAREVIQLVGLNGREAAYPRELSGGMKQRVGIARSLAVKPAIWFLDEPFSALDPLIRRQMQEEFLRLQAVLKKTIIFITHDFLEALRLADRIAIMRDGRIVQVGRPSELVLRPADDYVAEFTRDVPREKIVTAADVMEPAHENLDLDQPVPADMPIESILPRFVGRTQPLAVCDQQNRILGQISIDQVLSVLTPASDSRS